MEDKDIIQNTPPDNGLKTVDLNELLQSLDPEKREIVSRAIYAIEEQKAFSGPLPPRRNATNNPNCKYTAVFLFRQANNQIIT